MLAERLQAALESRLSCRGATCFAQASIGLAAVYPQDGTDVESLLRNADIAMYRSKVAAPAASRTSRGSDEPRRAAATAGRAAVARALRNGDLGVEFQAKVNLNDGSLGGFEALARWNDSQLGVVSPVEFIAVAEDCGLIDELGAWVLNEACSTYRSCASRASISGHVSVNARCGSCATTGWSTRCAMRSCATP